MGAEIANKQISAKRYQRSMGVQEMTVPAQIKVYHIVHVDRLSSMIKDNCWSVDIVRKSK